MKFNGIKSLNSCKMVMFTKTQAIYFFFQMLERGDGDDPSA